jgi:hypothetical protein
LGPFEKQEVAIAKEGLSFHASTSQFKLFLFLKGLFLMKNKFSMAMSLALVLALIAATVVLADNVFSDGDGLAPVVDTPHLSLGNVCLGSTTTKPILHAISRNGNYPSTNVYAKNATVIVSIDTVTGSGLSASAGGSITIPSNWDLATNGALSPSVSSSITFTANTLGNFSGNVNYNASGARSSSGTLTRTDSLSVTATVVHCDTTPPALSLPGDMTVEATSAAGAAVTFIATATDTNPLSPVVTCDANSGDTFPLDDTTEVTCSATDAAGNTATDSFNVTVVDTTPPDVTTPSSITSEATGASGATVTYSGELAEDLVDGPLAASCSPVSGSVFGLGLSTVTCSAEDAHGNIGSSDFTIEVQDTSGPILALPADLTVEATSPAGAAVDFSASASDLVDGPVAVSCDWNDGDPFSLGTTLVSCSATDSNGNTSSGAFSITVEDTTPPSLTLPVDLSLEATGSAGAVGTFDASASDLVDGDVTVSCIPASGSTFSLGATTVNCSATDAVGNTATGSFSVTVVDTTAPDLTLPADQQLEATGPDGAAATFSASATDAVDGLLTVSCNANSGDMFPLGTTEVECSVSDATGNTAGGSFVIIVEDTTAPMITFASRTAANANGWNNGDVTVNWSCSDTVGVLDSSVGETVSIEGENKSATGTCEDTSGNTASDTQTGINIDKTKPSASASRTPAPNANGWNNSDVTVSFEGTDALSGIDSCSAHQVFGEGANQSASGTCTDKAGNVSDTATVSDINVDKTPPSIAGAPDRSPNSNGWYNADVTISFECDDNLSGVASCTDPISLDQGADQSVTGDVADQAGNTASGTVSGINIDKTDPVINAGLDRTGAVSGWFNISTGAPTVSFTCSDALSGLDDACPSPYLFADGEDQSYNKSVSDLAGNSASAGVSDVDVDTVAPSIAASVSPARPAGGWWNIASGAPTATYSCSDGTSGIASCTSAYVFAEGEDQNHSGTASDNAGNSASDSVNNIDVDLTAPAVLITPARGPDYNGWYNAPVSFSFNATDLTAAVESCDPDADYAGPDSATANVSGSCIDKAGNAGSESLSFQYDNTDPSIVASIAPSASDTGWWNIATGAPTVSFTCSDATADLESCQSPHTFGNGEGQGFTGAAKDNAGNTSSATVNNIDVDRIAPLISAALDRTADGATGWFNASTGAPTVEFTCSDSGSSGLADCPDDYLFGQGADQYRNGIAYDHAGNDASAGVEDVDVDTVAPTILASLSPAFPADSGWYNELTGAPIVSFACSDLTSGLAGACPMNFTFLEGANQAHSQTIYDVAGNSASDGVSDISIDLTDPSLAWNGGPASGGSYDFGYVPATATCTEADTLSGPNGCIVTGYGDAVGLHIMTATANDVAGNVRTESRSYSVLAWLLRGFYQPVDMNNVYNIARNGSTVPLKFEIFAQLSNAEITDTSSVEILSYAQVSCSLASAEDPIETLATGNTALRYDTTSGQFIFNWKTPSGTAGKCFRVTMKTDDGNALTAYFKMK